MGQTFLRWAGSKRKTLGKLRAYWKSSYSRYVEPFAGSACLFFEVEPQDALLGDLNAELVVTLRAVKANVGVVIEAIRRLPVGESHYYRIRSQEPISLPDSERAARFIYLNRFCFNGLYRTNASGKFNVPYGSQRKVRPIDVGALPSAASTLRSATIIRADFEETLSRTKPGDFVYIDPPYVIASRRVFKDYAAGSFCHSDLRRLRNCLLRLNSMGIHFVVTYGDSAEARELLSDFAATRIWTRRNIAGFASHRRGSYELLATNILL